MTQRLLKPFIIFLMVVLAPLSAQAPFGLNESAYTVTLKPLTTAAAWRTALGITGSGSGSPFTNLFDYGQVTVTNASNTGYTLIQSNKVTIGPGGSLTTDSLIVSGDISLTNPNGSFWTNVNGGNLFYPTNTAASLTVALSRGGRYEFFSTNANFTYAGVSGTSLTNPTSATILITNTLGSIITITPPAAWIGGAPFIVTNQAVLTVLHYPGAGTNVVFQSLK